MAIIGIDLGTTNSAVAQFKNGKPEIIENRGGARTTPSVFHITEQRELVVGESAKTAVISMPEHVVTEVKRLMGTDEIIVVAGENYRPEEISAQILRELKLSAEDKIGEEVTEAVITVPAYFSDAQRKATQKAGELAGLKVDRIINEPTAAAIAYGIENMEKEQHILIYDLGGGTFDVSIVELFDGVVDVKASGGNNTLGGMDFDEKIMEFIVDEFNKLHGINLLTDGSEGELVIRKNRLKEEAERVKKLLSTQVSTKVSIPMILMKDGVPLTVDLDISRLDFERMIRELITMTITVVDGVLEDAKLDENQIDEILLIGGSTRIPAIQEVVEQRFTKAPRKDINPDEAVALGAAIQAGIKSNAIASESGLIVTDVAPYSLGIEVSRFINNQKVKGYYDKIIPRNSTIPISETKQYQTVDDNQTGFDIAVYQGEEERVTDNEYLGSLAISNVPPAPAGQENLEITFNYDINGNLEVNAKITSTGETMDAHIKHNSSMTEADVNKSKRNMDRAWDQSELYKEVEALMYRAEKIREDMDPEQQSKIDILITDMKLALSSNNTVMVKQYEEELTDVLMEFV